MLLGANSTPVRKQDYSYIYLQASQNIVLPIFRSTYNNLLYFHYSILTSTYFNTYVGYVIKTPFIWLTQSLKLNPVTNTFYLKVYSS